MKQPTGITPLTWSVAVNRRGEHVLRSDVGHACVALISSYKREHNEPYIVQACNQYPKLVEALREIAAWKFDIMGDCVADAKRVANDALAACGEVTR